jgi:hypothetical protein
MRIREIYDVYTECSSNAIHGVGWEVPARRGAIMARPRWICVKRAGPAA